MFVLSVANFWSIFSTFLFFSFIAHNSVIYTGVNYLFSRKCAKELREPLQRWNHSNQTIWGFYVKNCCKSFLGWNQSNIYSYSSHVSLHTIEFFIDCVVFSSNENIINLVWANWLFQPQCKSFSPFFEYGKTWWSIKQVYMIFLNSVARFQEAIIHMLSF